MKTKQWCWWLVLVGIVFNSSQIFSQDSVRVAFLQLYDATSSYNIPATILDRAKKDGYNYVAVELPLNPAYWNTAQGIVISDSLRIKLTAAFINVNNHGLRFIPMYQMMHGDAQEWGVINANIANTSNTCWSISDTKEVKCPSYSPDPYGVRLMDSTVKQLVTTIKAAFDSAHLSYPLEYIHIGHDELMVSYGSPRMLNIATTSTADTAFVNSYGGDSAGVQNGIQQLIANEINRRVSQITTISPGTKVMIWADMFDPQFNGGTHWQCNSDLFYNGTPTTITTGGALSLIENKDQLIFMPWDYLAAVSDPNRPNSNAQLAFEYFRNNNCHFVWTWSIVWIDSMLDTSYLSLWSINLAALNDYVKAGQLTANKNNSLGYCAAIWATPGDQQFSKLSRTLEYTVQKVQFPYLYQ